MDMKFRFLGGADMVGRMGMTMETGKSTFLVEYGLSPTKPPEFPLPAPKVDYVFLTHAHLDHCGMLPQVCGTYDCKLFTAPLSAEIGELMMKDTLKIAKAEGYVQPYTDQDIKTTMESVVPMRFGDTISLNNIDISMIDAGHIPGAAMFEFEKDVKTIYTGDIHTETQKLVKGARPSDCTNLFIEGTYAGRYHPARKETEKAFMDKIREVVERGGKAIIPCFANGRTQEIMVLLRNLGYDMWVDGMGRKVTKLFLRYDEYLREPGVLRSARKRFNEVTNGYTRDEAKEGEVIITTGGMLDGGPVLGYMKAVRDDPKSAILLVGYQAEDTNGRMLLEKGCVDIDGEICRIACEIQKYDFSAHADHGQILSFIERCDPDNIVIMHSDNRDLFLQDLSDYNVILPETGKEFHLEV